MTRLFGILLIIGLPLAIVYTLLYCVVLFIQEFLKKLADYFGLIKEWLK